MTHAAASNPENRLPTLEESELVRWLLQHGTDKGRALLSQLQKMRVALSALVLLISTNVSACEFSKYVSEKTKPLPPRVFSGISHFMLIDAIIKQLGPAARDVGSGLHVLEWDVTDGRVFFISASSCGKPHKVGFRKNAPNKPMQPTARENAHSG